MVQNGKSFHLQINVTNLHEGFYNVIVRQSIDHKSTLKDRFRLVIESRIAGNPFESANNHVFGLINSRTESCLLEKPSILKNVNVGFINLTATEHKIH